MQHGPAPRNALLQGSCLAFALLAWPAQAMTMTGGTTDWLHSALLAVLALGMLAALTLAMLAYRGSLRPAPVEGISREELEEMRRAVSAFATLLRDGSSVLIKTHHGTLETAHLVAAQSQQLIALVADSEARLGNATQRSEILATRVAKSAAAEIKAAVQQLIQVSARIEEQTLAPNAREWSAKPHSPG